MTSDYQSDQKQKWLNVQLSWIEAVYDAAFNNNETPPEGAGLWLYIIKLLERDQSRNELVTALDDANKRLARLQRPRPVRPNRKKNAKASTRTQRKRRQ